MPRVPRAPWLGAKVRFRGHIFALDRETKRNRSLSVFSLDFPLRILYISFLRSIFGIND